MTHKIYNLIFLLGQDIILYGVGIRIVQFSHLLVGLMRTIFIHYGLTGVAESRMFKSVNDGFNKLLCRQIEKVKPCRQKVIF